MPDVDVYDAAAWRAPGPISEISVAKGSAPVRFPDFTRGGWQKSRKSIPNAKKVAVERVFNCSKPVNIDEVADPFDGDVRRWKF